VNDILLNKIVSIERCLTRITSVYAETKGNFLKDQTRQDSVILNIQRACEASIDIANHLNKTGQLGIPQTSRDSFQLLFNAGLISEQCCQKMKLMIGFRNIAIHDYQQLDLAIVETIITQRLVDFQDFISQMKKYFD